MRRFGEVDSTNRYLLDQARSGAPEGVVAVADHQTAGRGRLGRTWLAPPGSSLLVSVLLRPALPAERLHLAVAAVALAACDACESEAGVRPAVKWPNDLVVDDGGAGERKLAGVLAEVALPAVVVGIGINVNWPPELPPELAGRATALNHLAGRDVSREGLLERLLAGVDARLPDWQAVASEYRRRCATLGRPVRVELAGGTVDGTAVDLTGDGHLVVDGEGGRRTVGAGDVVHVR